MPFRGLLRLFALALVGVFFPATASALVPKIVGNPVIGNPSFDGIANTMMYTVTVTVDRTAADADHVATVGFASEDDFTSCTGTPWKDARSQTFDITAKRSWTLYNFVPGTTYYYRVRIGSGRSPLSRCGILQTPAAPTPTLPTNLSYLNLNFERGGAAHPSDTKYVLLETDDCGGSGTMIAGARDYIVVIDPENETIVWYLDIAAAAKLRGGSGTGLRYQPGPTASSGRILLSVSRRYLFEWAFDGTTVHSYDFGAAGECEGDAGAEGPCLHHDVFKSNDTGRTYALSSTLSSLDGIGTEWEDRCGADALFIDDGYTVLDSRYSEIAQRSLIEDYGYDPVVDPGPHATGLASRPSACSSETWSGTFDAAWGVIDWTHANSLTASRFGGTEVLDLSLKEWDQVLRFNANTGALEWRLSGRPADSDWGTIAKAAGIVGASTFSGQHDVHATGLDRLMMFDNHGDPAGARVLELALDSTSGTPTIEKSWAMVSGAGNPLGCGVEGSAEQIPGSVDEHVLAMCAEVRVVSELDDPTGNSGNPPPLVISLPDGTRAEFCTSGGPDERSMIRGWHRAFPMATVGQF